MLIAEIKRDDAREYPAQYINFTLFPSTLSLLSDGGEGEGINNFVSSCHITEAG